MYTSNIVTPVTHQISRAALTYDQRKMETTILHVYFLVLASVRSRCLDPTPGTVFLIRWSSECSLMCKLNVVDRISCFCLIIFFLRGDWGWLWQPWLPPDNASVRTRNHPIAIPTLYHTATWRRCIVVRKLVSAGELSLSCARLLAGWVTTLWLSHPLSVSQHGQLSYPSLWGR